jgi:cytochrome c oxidase assembly factor CtaG
VLYALRARRLDRHPPPWRIACFSLGLAIVALALFSPIDAVGEDGLLEVHMLQHTLLGAIAPLFLVLGLTGPMLRPVLARRGADRLMALAHPWVAFSAWAADLAFWHIPPVYDAALADDALHATEHVCLVIFGLILWAPIVEPVRGPGWFTTRLKVAYMAGVWFVGLLGANILWFSGTVIYAPYQRTAPSFGVSALRDQGDAGTVMMVTHCLIAFGAAAVLFFRQAEEEQLRQRLIESGIDPVRVDRAVKAGRAEELARRHGIPSKVRAGID